MPKSNVMHFLSSDTLNGLYSGRVQKYLQPEYVGWNFYADTDEAFEEITVKSGWDLLVIDTQRVELSGPAIQKFKSLHPGCRILVFGEVPASSEPLPGAKYQASPSDIDDWLAVMHSNLGDRP